MGLGTSKENFAYWTESPICSIKWQFTNVFSVWESYVGSFAFDILINARSASVRWQGPCSEFWQHIIDFFKFYFINMAVLQTLDFRFSQIIKVFRSWVQRHNTVFWTFKSGVLFHKKLKGFCVCWRRWKWSPLVGWVMLTLRFLINNIHLGRWNWAPSLDRTPRVIKIA